MSGQTPTPALDSCFVCPECHARLIEEDTQIFCSACKLSFCRQNGIPVFIASDQPTRFVEAQHAETVHHEEAWTKLRVGGLPWVKSLEDYREWLESFYKAGFYAFGFPSSYFKNLSVLEVGSGPLGMLACVPTQHAVAIDPLMPEFAPYMQPHWEATPIRAASLGEKLPLADRSFDAAVAINCLDHTFGPDKIIEEVERVLKPGGLFFLMNNVKSAAGVAMSAVGERLKIERLREVYHPHAFTQCSLERECKCAGLEMLGCCSMKLSDPLEVVATYGWKAKLKRRLDDEHSLWILARKPEAS